MSHVFKALADQKTYVLISGRWFRSASFEGPWEFVAGSALPADFAAIPDGQGGWEQIVRPPTSGNAPGAGGSGTPPNLAGQAHWSRAQPSAANQQHFQELNRQLNAREQGIQRQQSYQRNRPAFGGGARRR